MAAKIKTESINKETPDLAKDAVERLKDLFPEAMAEGKVDFEKLRATLGDVVDDRPERYSFSWAGKRDAIRMLQTPSRATLKPASKESVNFDTTQNLFIEGDNLEVLKLLYKPYFGRVKMIYIDPPYNTGNDFVYPDNYADPLDTYLKLTGQKDSNGNLLTSNPDTGGRYHSSWLSMLYPRLFLARQLLREDGVIFISIDDHEIHNLRMVMNEIFGEENFVALSIWQRKQSPQPDEKNLSLMHEYVCVFARDISFLNLSLLPRNEEALARFINPDNDPRGAWQSGDMSTKTNAAGHSYEVKSPNGKVFLPPKGRQWGPSKTTYERMLSENRIWFGADGTNAPRIKQFLSEVQPGIVPGTLWLREVVGDNQESTKELKGLEIEFDSPKPTRLIKHILKLATRPMGEDIIVDFFSGSATTAQATLELNREDGGDRRFILVQLPEPTENKEFPTIAEIGKERIRRVIAKMKKEKTGELPLKDRSTQEDLGFKVFKLAESHYKPWSGVDEKKPEAYAKAMSLFTDPLVPGWKPEDVIWEVAVKEGFGLTSRIEIVKEAKGLDVHRVTDSDKDQSFLICLENKLKLSTLKPLNLKKDTIFICRDAALDDETAANLALQCRLRTI